VANQRGTGSPQQYRMLTTGPVPDEFPYKFTFVGDQKHSDIEGLRTSVRMLPAFLAAGGKHVVFEGPIDLQRTFEHMKAHPEDRLVGRDGSLTKLGLSLDLANPFLPPDQQLEFKKGIAEIIQFAVDHQIDFHAREDPDEIPRMLQRDFPEILKLAQDTGNGLIPTLSEEDLNNEPLMQKISAYVAAIKKARLDFDAHLGKYMSKLDGKVIYFGGAAHFPTLQQALGPEKTEGMFLVNPNNPPEDYPELAAFRDLPLLPEPAGHPAASPGIAPGTVPVAGPHAAGPVHDASARSDGLRLYYLPEAVAGKGRPPNGKTADGRPYHLVDGLPLMMDEGTPYHGWDYEVPGQGRGEGHLSIYLPSLPSTRDQVEATQRLFDLATSIARRGQGVMVDPHGVAWDSGELIPRDLPLKLDEIIQHGTPPGEQGIQLTEKEARQAARNMETLARCLNKGYELVLTKEGQSFVLRSGPSGRWQHGTALPESYVAAAWLDPSHESGYNVSIRSFDQDDW
jgi:hypothetical protein